MPITSIFVDPNNTSSNKPTLTMILDNRIHLFELRDDLAAGTYDFDDPPGVSARKIQWSLETGFTQSLVGYLMTFVAVLLRMALKSDGTNPNTTDGNRVAVDVLSIDDTTAVASSYIDVEAAPKKMYNIPIGDQVLERIRVKVSGSNTVLINKLVAWVAEKAQTRPR